MKRFLGLFLAALVLCSSAFSKNFLSERFFEMETTVDLGISNNVLSMNELMKKNLVIDLKKIATSMPKNGMVVSAYNNTCISFNLKVPLFSAGIDSGVEVYQQTSLSKDIFEAIANGTEIGETLDVDVMNYTDVFSYVDMYVGLNFGRFKIEVKPAVFAPLLSSSGSAVSLKLKNDEDGSIYAKCVTDFQYYSPFDFTELSSVNAGGFFDGMGFDIAGTLQIPLDFKTTVGVTGRIPFIPGRINRVNHLTTESTVDLKIFDLDNAITNSGKVKNYSEDVLYYVNRPLKMDAFINYKPLGVIFDLTAGLGFGIYHPFMSGSRIYPEYYFAASANMIDLFKISLSTEYTDQVFKNQLGTVINLRIIEIDAGISLQAATFAKSFTGSGLGTYVVFALGF